MQSAQDSTNIDALRHYASEMYIALSKAETHIDSLNARVNYLEHVLFDTLALRWSGGDPDGDPVTYDVYFGTDNTSPPLVATVQDTFYVPGRLAWNTTYYWYIVATDNPTGRDPNSTPMSSTGPLWHFTTMPVPERLK